MALFKFSGQRTNGFNGCDLGRYHCQCNHYDNSRLDVCDGADQNMKKIIIAIAIACLNFAPAAFAQPSAERIGHAWHNGSVMNVFTWQDANSQSHVRIEYLQPRPDLAAIGVVPGTILLTGQWINRELLATAVVFPNGCPAIPYAVRGTVDATETLTLFGPAPSLLGYWCEVLAIDWTANSELRFEPARSAAAALAQSQPLPVPRPSDPGGSCPHGYIWSGSFCAPSQGAQDAIAERHVPVGLDGERQLLPAFGKRPALVELL
jgi:hypothetical protein